MLLLLILLLATPPATPDTATITQAELVSRTQQMMDAVGTGDKHPWEKYLADDAMVFDEKGNDMNKKKAVANIEPLPTGYTGVIHVKNAKALFA